MTEAPPTPGLDSDLQIYSRWSLFGLTLPDVSFPNKWNLWKRLRTPAATGKFLRVGAEFGGVFTNSEQMWKEMGIPLRGGIFMREIHTLWLTYVQSEG